MQGFKAKKGKNQMHKKTHMSRKMTPKKQKKENNFKRSFKGDKTTTEIEQGIEAKMIGQVLKCQEHLKIIDKTHLRQGNVDFSKHVSGRMKMKEGRKNRDKIVLKK